MRDQNSRSQGWNRLQRWRLASQIIVLAGLFLIPVMNWYGIHWLMGTFYSISLGRLVITDPLLALQTVLLSREVWLALIVAAGVPAILALLLGRVFCSWMCPHNALSEWLDALKRRFFRHAWYIEHKKRISGNPAPLKYWLFFFALLVMLMILGFPIFGYLSPPGILSTAIAHGMTGQTLPPELLIVVAILVAEAAIGRRYWCNHLCPVGAMLALFRTRQTLQIRFDPNRCDCKGGIAPCHFVCPLNLSPKSENVYPFCFNCGLCVAVCAKTGSHALNFGQAGANAVCNTESRSVS